MKVTLVLDLVWQVFLLAPPLWRGITLVSGCSASRVPSALGVPQLRNHGQPRAPGTGAQGKTTRYRFAYLLVKARASRVVPSSLGLPKAASADRCLHLRSRQEEEERETGRGAAGARRKERESFRTTRVTVSSRDRRRSGRFGLHAAARTHLPPLSSAAPSERAGTGRSGREEPPTPSCRPQAVRQRLVPAARRRQPRREKGAEPPGGPLGRTGRSRLPGRGSPEPGLRGAPAPLGSGAGPARSPPPPPPGRRALPPGRRRHKERLRRRGGAREGAAPAGGAAAGKHGRPLRCSRGSGRRPRAGPSPRRGPRPGSRRGPSPPREHSGPSHGAQPSRLPPGSTRPQPTPQALTVRRGPAAPRPAAHPPTPPRARRLLPRPRRLISGAGRAARRPIGARRAGPGQQQLTGGAAAAAAQPSPPLPPLPSSPLRSPSLAAAAERQARLAP